MRTKLSDLPPSAVTGPREPARGTEAAWDVLDRYALALQGQAETAGQIRLTLEAVCDALGADAVYWDAGSEGDEGACVGCVALSRAERSALTAHLLESPGRLLFEDGQALVPEPAGANAPSGTVGAAMVRISRTFNSWIVALNCTPGRSFSTADLKVISLARRLLLGHRRNVHIHGGLRDSLLGLVRCLTSAIEAKDPYTCGHSERVARIGRRIGHQMGLSEAELGDVYLGGLMHDIGKIGVRDDILRKPGSLSPEEMAHVQQHTVIGDRIISGIRQLGHLRPAVRNHHERFDGAGYPDGLVGERIPLAARVLAVADSCDAMMSDRPYRRAMPEERIEAIIREGAGRAWDPAVVHAFMACRRELYQILQRGLGESIVKAVDRALDANNYSASVSSLKDG